MRCNVTVSQDKYPDPLSKPESRAEIGAKKLFFRFWQTELLLNSFYHFGATLHNRRGRCEKVSQIFIKILDFHPLFWLVNRGAEYRAWTANQSEEPEKKSGGLSL
jgi:hypothetical protein